MKKFIPTLLAFAGLVLLGGYIYFFERGPVKKAEEKKSKVFAAFIADDISDIRVENLGTTLTAEKVPIEVKKDEQGAWEIVSPRKLKADEMNLRTLLSSVGDFDPEITIEKPGNLADYGLANPSARYTFKTKAGLSQQLLIGDKNMSNSSVYLKAGDKNTVFLLPAFTVDQLKKRLNDYRDHTFLRTDLVSASKIRVTREGKTITFEKNKDNAWEITEPLSAKADEVKLRDLLNSASTLRADEFVEDQPTDLSKYGLSTPRAKFEVWSDEKGSSKAILVGRKKLKSTSVFVKSREQSAVVLVGEFFDKSLDLKVSDYRDKSFVKFEPGLAQTLTLHQGVKTLTFQKDDKGKWASLGRPKGQEEAISLINEVSQMAITDFASSKGQTGLANPSFTVEVSLSDGTKRNYRFGKVEKGQVYLASDNSKEVLLVPASVVSHFESVVATPSEPPPALPPVKK